MGLLQRPTFPVTGEDIDRLQPRVSDNRDDRKIAGRHWFENMNPPPGVHAISGCVSNQCGCAISPSALPRFSS